MYIATMLIVIVGIGMFFYVQNNWLHINEINIDDENLDLDEDLKVIHLSDLHNKMFGDNQERLVDKIKKLNPDIIVITGDIIDSRRYNEKPAIILMEKLIRIAKVYYVAGNHEIRAGVYEDLKERFTKIGIDVVEDRMITLKLKDEYIDLIGLKDLQIGELNDKLKHILKKEKSNNYKMLIVHRPEAIKFYSENKIDMVFAGHAHGGQIRIPLVGGIIAPGQGFFPKYTEGAYKVDDTTMIVSRGLGNSRFPFRVLNRPEIVVVKLKGRK